MITALKKNKLTQTLATGAAAIGVLAGVAMVSAPAQAQTWDSETQGDFLGFILNATTLRGPDSLPYTAVQLGDKLFDNFQFTLGIGTGAILPGDGINIIKPVPTTWAFEYDHQGGDGLVGGTYRYDVTITDPRYTFDIIEFDTETSGTPGGYLGTKNVSKPNDVVSPVLTLTSTNGSFASGSIASLGLQKITVVDNYATAGGGVLRGANNDFTQKKVPEPGTVLGLLAVGGLGLGLKRKKQG